MAQMQFTIDNFNQSSSWVGYYQDDGGSYYSTPTTATTNKTFSLPGLPANAILDAATLYSSLGKPYTGAAIRKIDGVTYSSETQKDVLAKLQALNGNYANGVSFEYRFKANGGQGTQSISGIQHSSTLAWRNNTLTITYHLPASTFTTSPSTSVNVDTNVTVTITPADAGYSHKVIRSIGSNSATTTLAAGTNSTTIQFPASWIPNATSATGTIKVETYSGSTKMGEASKTMTVEVPNTAPYLPTITLPNPEHIRDYASGASLPSDWPFTKGKSKAKLNGTCAPGNGSTIKSVVVSNGASGNAVLDGGAYTFTTGFLSPSGTYPVNVTYRMTVTDNRNRTAYAEKTITVHDYKPPACSTSSAARCDSEGNLLHNGTYIRVDPFFVVSSADGKNSYQAWAEYRQLPSGSWLGETAITHGTPAIIGGGNVNPSNSYEVRIRLRDELYPGVTEATKYITIGTEKHVATAINDTHVCLFGMALEEHPGFEIGNDQPLWLYGQDSDERYEKKSDNTASKILSKLLTVDGSGSGLESENSDKLDGLHASDFSRTGVISSGSLDDVTAPGVYYVNDISDAPSSTKYGALYVAAYGTSVNQTYIPHTTSSPRIYFRRKSGESWGDWYQSAAMTAV